MKRLGQWSAKLAAVMEKVVQVISIGLVIVLVCTVFFQVAKRIVTGRSIVEIEELSIVLASWCAFFTIAFAVRKKSHVCIEVFTEKLPFYVAHSLQLLIQAGIFAAIAILVKYGWLLAQRKMIVPMTVLPFKSGYWYIAFPIGMAFACVFLLDNVIQELLILKDGPNAQPQVQSDGTQNGGK